MGNGWQPIETAPKDGGWIWVTEPTGTWMGLATWRKSTRKGIGGVWLDWDFKRWEAGAKLKQPTHWMPLPDPPE